MADDELTSIRAKRMAELQGSSGGDQPNAEQQKAMQEQQELMKSSILKQVLNQDAWARLNNLMVAKPEKGRMAEAMIIQMARTGQIGGKLSDEELKKLLDRVSERTQKTTTVKYDRRRAAIDSDDED